MVRFITRRALPVGIAAAAVLSTWLFAARAGDEAAKRAKEPSFEILATQLSADNCPPSCPCLMGEAPHHGTCRFVAGFDVEKGKIGETDISGTRFGALGEFHGVVRDHPPLDLTKWYVCPEHGSKDAQAALVRLLGTRPFSGKRSYGVSVTRIAIERGDGELGVRKLSIGDKGSFEITPLAAPDGKRCVKIDGAWGPFEERAPVIVGSAKGSFKDGDLTLTVERGSGEVHQVRMAGALSSATD